MGAVGIVESAVSTSGHVELIQAPAVHANDVPSGPRSLLVNQATKVAELDGADLAGA